MILSSGREVKQKFKMGDKQDISLKASFDTRSKSRLLLFILGIILLVSACTADSNSELPSLSPTLNPPDVRVTQPPSAELTGQEFLNAWRADDYVSMYNLLAETARANLSQERFQEIYENLASETTLIELTTEIKSAHTSSGRAEIGYAVNLQTAILGDIHREMTMPLVLEDGQWKILWDSGLVLPELAGGNYLGLDREWSGRGTIFDRNGNPIASQTKAAAVGIWPDYIDPDESKGLLGMLGSISNFRSFTIAEMIDNANLGDYIPISEVPVEGNERILGQLSKIGSVVVSEYSRRFYSGDGIGPHLVGYVSPIQQEEFSTFRRKGYLGDDRVGRKGIELWGEETLMGKPGGALYVFNPQGKPVEMLGSAASIPGEDIFTTIDRDFQWQVQEAMSAFKGAIVVLEKDTGRVLALASTPGFDPNAFEIENYNWNTQLSEIVNDPNLPQFNRASQGQYPLGSVFKIITMAAALESGRFTAESTYDCGYTYDELGGITLYDWTWDHFQKDGKTQPSGVLTLPQGLIKSCNPWFYHLGNELYSAGLTTAVSDMARGFGLGSKTGIEGVEEEAGNVPDPSSPLDATNLAIGQGDLQVTPLQVARFIAAIGNGGTLLRPQVIEKIIGKDGTERFTFQREIQGSLPIKSETLKLIQEAMKGVPSSKTPMGTAYRELNDLKVAIAGKTGTATSQTGTPHAWFAGYSFENKENKPDIAVVVIAENAGEGSEIAAPIFRRVMEIYFFGRPIKLYRWESIIDVTRSPTPLVTDTPTAPPFIITR